MDPNREKELVGLLNDYDLSGVPFAQARNELLAKGFTEAELVYGLYSAPFDGKPNQPRPQNPLAEMYAKNPEQADKVAKTLLLAQAQQDFSITLADAAAAEFAPDIQSRSYYEVRTADRLGIPYFTLMFLGVIIIIISLKFNLSKEATDKILWGFSTFISLLFGYKFIQERRRINKLRK